MAQRTEFLEKIGLKELAKIEALERKFCVNLSSRAATLFLFSFGKICSFC